MQTGLSRVASLACRSGTQVIEHPEAPALSRCDEVALAHHQIRDGHRGQAGIQSLPVCTVVE